MLTRVEPEGTTSWTWGQAEATNTATNKLRWPREGGDGAGSYAEIIATIPSAGSGCGDDHGVNQPDVSPPTVATARLVGDHNYPTPRRRLPIPVQGPVRLFVRLLQDVKDFNNPARCTAADRHRCRRTHIDEAYGNNLHTYSTYTWLGPAGEPVYRGQQSDPEPGYNGTRSAISLSARMQRSRPPWSRLRSRQPEQAGSFALTTVRADDDL